jgi:endoribonuclease Dicer
MQTALLDLIVVKYLYDKFPEATSFQLSWLRSLAICSPALASIAVRRLELHNIMLVNNVELSLAISRYVPFLESCSGEDIVRHGWKHEPPKAISDVLESIMGALLVDSAYDFEKASSVALHLMDDVLAALSPTLSMNPISGLLEWTARAGCREVSLKYVLRL